VEAAKAKLVARSKVGDRLVARVEAGLDVREVAGLAEQREDLTSDLGELWCVAGPMAGLVAPRMAGVWQDWADAAFRSG
jgi:hypothetical protein